MNFPDTYALSGSSIVRVDVDEQELKADPRGLVLMWEEPQPGAKYIMGLDPSFGLTGWSRATRTDNDHKTDNGAIEVFRVDAIPMKVYDRSQKKDIIIMRDLQVAEFAAPVDAAEIAHVGNILGRIYCGDAEDQCECILESFPGPGVLTLQEFYRLGYTNLWRWEVLDGEVQETKSVGWHATPRSVQALWARSRRHLLNRRAKIVSPFLLEEYANAVIDMDKMTAKASYGVHDDRLRAANMCFWAGHDWEMEVERTAETVTQAKEIEWQNYAPGLGDAVSVKDRWNDVVDSWG